MKNTIEIRTFAAEIRAEGDEKPKIKGTACVFNALSADLGDFKEIIDPGFFGNTVYTDDVFALINHSTNLVLGRNKSGTLTLEETKKGLDFVVEPSDTSYAKDLLVNMRLKNLDKCSFAFIVADAVWEKIDGLDVRRVRKFEELWDISIVTYPAFYQTNAQVFGQDILTPKEVYAEYCSKTANSELLVKEKQALITREHNKRINTIKLLEKL